MTLQWYPGHMHKAQKEMRQVLPDIDIIIEVLDARIPFSSENPLIAELRGDTPCVKVLSKSDLADPENVALWQAHLDAKRGIKTLPITIKNPSKMLALPDLCRKLVPEKKSGVKKIKAMIVGIPNVGKSTLINNLAGRVIAKTGNEPAVTKRQQTIKLAEDFVLLDTPGILWPKQAYKNSSYRLAFTGAIRDTAIDYIDVAFFGADYLLATYPELLKARYQLDELPDIALPFLEKIAKKRGCIGSGGRVDLNKISEVFVNDFRSLSIGAISLETPGMIEAEVIEAKAIAEQKKIDDEARKKARRIRSRKNR